MTYQRDTLLESLIPAFEVAAYYQSKIVESDEFFAEMVAEFLTIWQKKGATATADSGKLQDTCLWEQTPSYIASYIASRIRGRNTGVYRKALKQQEHEVSWEQLTDDNTGELKQGGTLPCSTRQKRTLSTQSYTEAMEAYYQGGAVQGWSPNDYSLTVNPKPLDTEELTLGGDLPLGQTFHDDLLNRAIRLARQWTGKAPELIDLKVYLDSIGDSEREALFLLFSEGSRNAVYQVHGISPNRTKRVQERMIEAVC